MAGANLITLTSENFEREVMQSSVPVLVDFWAEWCGPCMRLAPVLEELATEYAGRLKIGKVDVDRHGELAAPYKVMSIPNLVFFKGGKPVQQVVGYKSKAELKPIIDGIVS
ncbi:thioredoxin [Fontisphaera persica]|uniref:thioredoxin n=1 Tax=Fontisphaera persica TaxID=2974023 RepID=UPI0024BF59D9|nr:thioredoxin [Fontisphaera persica]WCJ59840.1 thioredoxin [Fontisphaera persica]